MLCKKTLQFLVNKADFQNPEIEIAKSENDEILRRDALQWPWAPFEILGQYDDSDLKFITMEKKWYCCVSIGAHYRRLNWKIQKKI